MHLTFGESSSLPNHLSSLTSSISSTSDLAASVLSLLLSYKTMDLKSTVPLAIAAAFLAELPILLSATVVIISWLAGRVIDKIEVSIQSSIYRGKAGGMVQSAKRTTSHEKAADFHSSARVGAQRDGSVQELEALSVADDEGRLYNEQYGSEHSQEDGDRYDALGDSPGAQGQSRQVPRSPSMYSQFSQSIFSQSAYGPSAYGPSQRRFHGSVYGHSQYENASSQGSQYPGPVPSHFGASQLSDNTSYHPTGSAGAGGVHGAGAVVFPPGGIPAPYGGGMGRGGGLAQRLPPPTYNPYAPRPANLGAGVGAIPMHGGGAMVAIPPGATVHLPSGVTVPMDRGATMPIPPGATVHLPPEATVPSQGGALVPMPGGVGFGGAHDPGAIGAPVAPETGPGFHRGSPPPYSQAQIAQAQASGSTMLDESGARLDPNAQPPVVQGAAPSEVVAGATPQPQSTPGMAPSSALTASTSELPPASNASASVANPTRDSGTSAAGPKSGFGSDSEDGAASEVPSAFRP